MGYDRRPSPLSTFGFNGAVLGQGGLIDAVGGAFKNMGNDPIGSIYRLGKIYYEAKNNYGISSTGDLKRAMRNEWYQQFVDEMRVINNPSRERRGPVPIENPTRNVDKFFPSAGASPGVVGTASSPTIGQQIPNTVIDENGNTVTEYIQTGGPYPAPVTPVYSPVLTPAVIAEETDRIYPQPALPEFIPPTPIAYRPQPEITAGRQVNSVTQGPPTINIPQQVSYSGIQGYPTDIGLTLGGGITPNQTIVNRGGGGPFDVEATQIEAN